MVWCVVKSFEKHCTVFYTVPKTWLYEFEGQKFVFYPPDGTFKDTTKSIISLTPHSTAWKDWPADVIKHDFDKFLTAKHVEADVASDKTAWDRYMTQGVPKEFGVGKRFIKRPKKLAEKSTTEVDDSDSSETASDNHALPSPPKKHPRKSPEKEKRQQGSCKVSPKKTLASTRVDLQTFSPIKTKTLDSTPAKMKPISPIKKITVASPKKSMVKKSSNPPEKAVPSSLTLKKTVSDASALMLSSNKPSTSKANVPFMPARNIPETADSSVVGKRKTETLDIEQWLAANDSALEQSRAGNIPPSEATSSGQGTRQPTGEQIALFNAKKLVAMDKKLDRIWMHLENNMNLEGQLNFVLPCKDYKRVKLVDNLLRSDKTQFDLLVKVLKSQPSPSSRVGSMVNVMLRFLLVDSAARKFCFTGSETKFDFKSTNLNQAVTEAVLLMKRNDNISVEFIGKAVASWLNQAKKRIQNRAGVKKSLKKSPKKSKKKHLPLEELHTSQSEGDLED